VKYFFHPDAEAERLAEVAFYEGRRKGLGVLWQASVRRWSARAAIRSGSGSSASQIFIAFRCGDFPSRSAIANWAGKSKSWRSRTTGVDLAIGRRGSDRPLSSGLNDGYLESTSDASGSSVRVGAVRSGVDAGEDRTFAFRWSALGL